MIQDDAQRAAEEREERNMVHVHTYCTITAVADGHQHTMAGTTAPSRMTGQSHVHRIRVRTSFHAADGSGHWHWFDTMTGPAIDVTNEMHIHFFQGDTSIDDKHCHEVENSTNQAPNINGEEQMPIPEPMPEPPKAKTKYPKR